MVSCSLVWDPSEVLSLVAGLDTLSLGVCIVVTELSFCSASIVGSDLLERFLSSTEGSEAAIVLSTGGRNATAPKQR